MIAPNIQEMARRFDDVFPPHIPAEHPAVDLLRNVHRMAKIAASLLDDARIYGNTEQERADFYNSVAQDAAKLMLSVAEEALRAMTDKGITQ